MPARDVLLDEVVQTLTVLRGEIFTHAQAIMQLARLNIRGGKGGQEPLSVLRGRPGERRALSMRHWQAICCPLYLFVINPLSGWLRSA